MLASTFQSSSFLKGLRTFATSSQKNYKVAVLGGAGGIGQPLALLLKHCPLISQLAIYDIAPYTKGVAKDLSHVDTLGKITGYTGTDELDKCLKGSALVLMTAGIPNKSKINHEKLFNSNANITMKLSEACAKNCPKAVLAIITNPVNSTVPIASEVYLHRGVYNPGKIFGVTTLNVVRANVFLANAKGFDVLKTNVPVIGGHSEGTILPLLSQAIPHTNLSASEVIALTKQIQDAGTDIERAKVGMGSVTLSMAYAGARFALSVLQAMRGAKGVIECAFVASDIADGVPFFTRPVLLGKHGRYQNLGLGNLSDFEKSKLEYEVLPGLRKDISKGITFVNDKIKCREFR